VILDEEPTLIDAATANATEQITEALEGLGVPPSALSNVVVSHVHLDHSGTAAGLAQRASDLDVYIHERTMDHLVDPTHLVESTKQVLGDAFDKLGAPDPLPESNVVPVSDDGLTIDTGDRSLDVVHTPGHALDHLAVWDRRSSVAFTNEAIGRFYPKADCWVPPITLPDYHADAVADSIHSLRDLAPETVALSHVGTLPAEEAFQRAADRLDAFDAQIPEWYEETGDIESTKDRVRGSLLSLADAYPESIVETQADVCTKGVLNDNGYL
jgi:glyoxylase-like metal-dependent hydrolase (beta-lactamase superfamily II)